MITILCVDDEPDMEMLVTQQFRKQIRNKEYEFIFACHGQDALEKLAAHSEIKIVLSDINMPEMDGLTFLSKLKELNITDLKTIMVSAYGDMDNIRTAMNRGAFDFITKPINFDDMEITIKKTLSEIEVYANFQHDRDKLIAIEKDLAIAYEIQQSMLPKKENPFPDRHEFSLHGLLQPAKSVGGDLYDYMLLSDDRLLFFIGDVSDKGVPAALFMAITRTLFKTHFASYPNADLTEQIVHINNIMARDNPSYMFVTVFACILNIQTGVIEYVDCGHEQPLILRKATGEVEVLKKKDGGLPICLVEDFPYFSSTFKLNPGDSVILYTDGLEDARNITDVRYTIDSSKNVLKCLINDEPSKINTDLLMHVNSYIGTANQFDDIALLTLKYHGTSAS
ncbi:PP2C family protein-serine/threonine phosphatase [Mucilaginibacter aquatilis]|uniref:SpoIIE family protein phosphatase n=1 Tax=Mucilaginibacter aquatilis TaxID=1517760 RepID=A0A6I4I7Z6_9SPHI|nr:SpoIIE family protein phosphatase [Mucilaginibacter aquatilis]MVN91241.1 SpoIIE family protein phosphatase [Mucilaginibacter aquatilis]